MLGQHHGDLALESFRFQMIADGDWAGFSDGRLRWTGRSRDYLVLHDFLMTASTSLTDTEILLRLRYSRSLPASDRFLMVFTEHPSRAAALRREIFSTKESDAKYLTSQVIASTVREVEGINYEKRK